ncbi:endo-1,4-beta-xylanase [Lacihabitans sp. LS3-19]|uniref:endo-1,4-beta-xylanase n=1 Tax=Lacihabitans sp. LS3-19 TaxID=2487335 RepID=UPI0020CC38B9|nr:endo-1,4-beta-xylanase [Lacihabitans sp. LS3-19]MCP9769765.1 endo-1,4-beta-xylanase [Lacihabitans sp. LS3-19]
MRLITIVFFLSSTVAFSQEKLSLKSKFANDFKIGAAVNPAIVNGQNKISQDIVIEHFNSITVENVMKTEVVNPKPGEYDWTAADEYVAFGKKHNMFVIGHTLVWHNQTPDWFFFDEKGNKKPKDAVKQRLHDHIKTVAGRYSGKVQAWDVVNEVIDDDGTYRSTKWVEGVGGGDELVRLSFKYAAQYAPNTELYYNDFNAWRPEKVKGIVRLVKMLKKEGIRIDGVGIQGHWGLNYPNNQYIKDAIDAYAACGVKVMITELDVDVLPVTREGQIIGQAFLHKQFQNEEFKEYLDPYQNGLPADILQQLSDRYKELFEIFYSKKDKIDRVTLWGVQDQMSWKNGYPIPGRTNYPLLWDREGKAKPVLDVLLKSEF